MKIVLLIYDIVLLACIPLYYVYLCIKGKFHLELLGRCRPGDVQTLSFLWKKDIIWLHAVSLGEVSTAKSLIKQLSLRYPSKVILITTITMTGKTLAESLAAKNVVGLYMPFDISFLMNAFIRKINPQVLLLLETELWPNMLYLTKVRNIPTYVLNARISDKSYAKYLAFSWFARRLTVHIRKFCVQSSVDFDRLQNIGIPPEKIALTGNMKFDAIEELSSQQMQELSQIKEHIVLDLYDILLVAGSTHPQEEEYLIDVFMQLKNEFKTLRLLIAPRHLERLPEIEKNIHKRKLTVQRISNLNHTDKNSVLLLDTIGKLRLVYSLADFVFVGGSLVPKGGHNILEPAFFAKPIIVGPYMHNFRKVTQLFLSSHALEQVSDAAALQECIKNLIIDKDKSRQLGAAAKSVVASHQGATLKNLSIIAEAIR